jgi:hypothetical protein
MHKIAIGDVNGSKNAKIKTTLPIQRIIGTLDIIQQMTAQNKRIGENTIQNSVENIALTSGVIFFLGVITFFSTFIN